MYTKNRKPKINNKNDDVGYKQNQNADFGNSFFKNIKEKK